METRDNAGGDEPRNSSSDASADVGFADGHVTAGVGDVADSDGTDSLADTELHQVLRGIADDVPPMRDPLSGVLQKATRLKRRRRTTRAVGAAVVLAAGIGVAPSLVDKFEDFHNPDVVVAAPPSKVLELPGAYPLTTAASVPDAAAQASDVPSTALGWESRGTAAPSQVVDIAKSYLVAHAHGDNAPGTATAEVHQLWAQADSTGKPAGLFIGEGWTSGPAGMSQAYLVSVQWYATPTKTVASFAQVAIFPTRFMHAEAGSPADPMEVDRISEVSFVTASGKLLVIGAPQVKQVLYADAGRGYVAQKTFDGVAFFPRTTKKSRGSYVDQVQVRDGNDTALTPPGGWPAGDFSLTTAVWFDSAPSPSAMATTSQTPVSVEGSGGTTASPAPAATTMTPAVPLKKK